MQEIIAPPGFDWQTWVDRWDRMQERYLVDRAERFAVMIRMIRATQPAVTRVLDLGAGPGSLTVQLLEAFPQAEIIALDFDPTMLLLARQRLSPYGARARLLSANLRQPAWPEAVPAPCDAVVSATALHWLSPEELTILYQQVARVLRPGGIFMNADHVGSEYAPLQKAWEGHRDQVLARQASTAEDWHSYWQAYSRALGMKVDPVHRQISGGEHKGVEQGLPLPWHFHMLKESGFRFVDCFWRSDGDAVYGGILKG